MALKIAMIGAGSIGFTRRLMHDILTVPELQDTTFTFMDISERNLGMVTQLARRDVEFNKLPAKVESTTSQREAVTGADYVICMIRQGGLDAFALDIDIPLKYSVDQCVGDTLCAGGIMYGQRTIPALLNICKDIREVAQPDALFLNYSNPMAMNTWACNLYGGVKTIGLCHGVQGAHWQIAHVIELWAKKEGLLAEDQSLHRKEVDVICAGINHQTWFVKVQWRGMDMLPRLLELFEAHPEYQETEKVRIDVLRRFGYYSTESNGHFSEYVPWYRKRVDEIPQWIDLSSWINGETGGYLRVCTEGRNWFETDFPNWMKEEPPTIGPERRSEEHGSYIIEGLETGRTYRGHFNVVNQGHITNLPDGCVIEIPGYVDKNGINMPVVGDLPMACAATCSASVRVQQMSMEAAVHGDVTLLKQAMLHDPLAGAVCNPEEVWQMTDEMLVAQAQWLPNYAGEIDAARARLAAHEANGTRVKLQNTRGAARLQIKSVEEMARDKAAARANATAADKGKMTKASAH
ncbi:MAG: alpha-glucosidase/alpha-galactosidase [Anaerolineae bacterium]|nr:alpha-glucosidase/alpha-galactosidase [Anaerolineae bacterium]